LSEFGATKTYNLNEVNVGKNKEVFQITEMEDIKEG